MKTLSSTEFLNQKTNDVTLFPFCFQKSYLNLHPNILILHQNSFFAPIKITKSKFLKIAQFQFPPLDNAGERLNLEEEKGFCEAAIKFISENKLAHRILQPKNYSLFFAVPKGSIAAPFGTYRINLLNKLDVDLLNAMQARYRSAIRQIDNLNVEIKFGLKEIDVFQKLHEETMNRTGAFSEHHKSLKDELITLPNNTLLATIYIDNIIQGGVYIMYSKFSAFYFHGASANNTIASGAIKYLHFKVMCLMIDKGVKQYDFVGARLTDISQTKLEGIQDFKKRFGSELIKGYLWKLDIDKLKCRTYDNLLKLKCKLKGSKFPIDIIDQEKNKQTVL